MIEKIVTENSTYELRTAQNGEQSVRRVSGVNPPTGNFEADGKWHRLGAVEPYFDGLLFIFRAGVEPIKATRTRAILSREVIEP